MDRQQEYVLRTVEERGVRFVRLWFTDVLGQLKSLEITPVELEGALEDGMTFDGSAVDGFSRLQEADMIAVPDASTFELLPWRTDDLATARIFCDITRFDGSPFEGCPRQVLRRGLQRARDDGYAFLVGPDVEWFYFEGPDAPPKPLDRGSFFDLTATDVSSELRKSTTLACEAMGIPVRYSHHEDSPGQQEIDLRYTDALSMADNLMTFKLLVKEIAHQRGVHASFMPKPLPGVQGSGMHLNVSLFAGDENAFHDPDNEYELSAVGRSFLAGLLVHAREITAVTNQWINSYKRLVSGFEAPTFVAWAHNNGSAMTRVPSRRTGKAASSRVEYRAADPACNPYLAFSVLLAAGLAGVRGGYELGPELTDNLYELTPAERSKRSITELPSSMGEALVEMEASQLVADALGEHVFEWFIRNKRAEWQEYRREVTPFELDRYLPLL